MWYYSKSAIRAQETLSLHVIAYLMRELYPLEHVRVPLVGKRQGPLPHVVAHGLACQCALPPTIKGYIRGKMLTVP